MQLTEEQLFAMYGKAVAENQILRAQLINLEAELQVAKKKIVELEDIFGDVDPNVRMTEIQEA